MKNKSWLLLTFLAVGPVSAFAGSSSADCRTNSNSINFSVGNGSHLINIDYRRQESGEVLKFEAPVQLMPYFDYNAELTERTISAIPTGPRVDLTASCTQMRITRADGSQCYGRQFWDNTYQQRLLLAGANTRPLTDHHLLGWGVEVEGLTADGYIQAEFSCREYGASTSGGCFIEGNDEELVESVPCDNAR